MTKKKKPMTKDEHNKESQRLLGLSTVMLSSPTPWQFDWDGDNPPRILDAKGSCVCVLSTGTFSGSYTTDEIISNAKRLLSGDENIEAIKVAVKLSEHLDAKEQAMFIAGFEECLKWQAGQHKKEIERLKAEQLVWMDTKIDPPQKGDVILGWRVEKDLGYIVPMEWNPACDTPEEYPYYMPYPLPPKQ